MASLFFEDALYHSIVEQVYELIKENVILTNEKGIIVASTDPTRINQFHEGALLAIRKRKKMVMTKELSEKLQGVRMGIVLPIIIDENAIGVIGITGDPQVIEPYGLLVQKMTEVFIKESIIHNNHEKLAREIDFFVFDWINSKKINESLIQRSYFFNINMQQYNRIILFKMNRSALHLTYKEINKFKEIWDEEDALFIRWGQDKLYILIKPMKNSLLREKLLVFLDKICDFFQIEAVVGVGQPTSYESIYKSYHQANLAASIANEKNPIVFEEDMRFEILQYALNEEIKSKLIERSIQPILDEKVLIDTLHNWFQHQMSIQKTAKYLRIHKNTLHYRLKKIEELTGLNIADIEDLSILYISYRFLCERIN